MHKNKLIKNLNVKNKSFKLLVKRQIKIFEVGKDFFRYPEYKI